MPRLSLLTLRNIILVALVVGVAGYTAIMFSVSQRLGERFGPQVREDLEWRVQRGAQELARACDVGLVVGDAALLKKAFGAYAESSDVQAIVAVDASGKVLSKHGTSPEPVAKLFSGGEQRIRAGSGYLVSWADATIEGSSVGRVALVVSTRRLVDANALLARASRVTLFGGVCMLILGVIVVTLFTRAVMVRDAQLSDYAGKLEQKVEERTRELDERNRGMRLVLDNVAQGFVTIDLHGTMASERSAIIDRWFGAPEADSKMGEYLRPHAAAFADMLELNLDQLRDGFLPADVVLAQMPARFSANGRTFEVVYTPLGKGDDIERVLVIINDITDHLAREQAEREQKELMAIFQRILVDRTSVEEFLAEASRLVSGLEVEQDTIVQRRLVHTLKGNSAMYGLGSLADLAHEIESQMIENDAPLDGAQRALLSSAWRDAIARVQELLGRARKDRVEIERGELSALVERARAGASASQLVRELESWQNEPIERRLEQLGRQACGLARRLGKPEPNIVIQSGGVRLDAPIWSSYWAAMVHAVRNAVDHGLESAPVREAAGKPSAGRISLSARRAAGKLVISLEDDGGGIDWERVKATAERAGRASATHSDLVEALFIDGFTTRAEVSGVSGRGVGLAALRQAVRDLEGSIEVESKPGSGTVFRFIFEEGKLGRVQPTPSVRRSAVSSPA